jgi:hypothetical protein
MFCSVHCGPAPFGVVQGHEESQRVACLRSAAARYAWPGLRPSPAPVARPRPPRTRTGTAASTTSRSPPCAGRTEAGTRDKRLTRNLEAADTIDQDLIRGISQRRSSRRSTRPSAAARGERRCGEPSRAAARWDVLGLADAGRGTAESFCIGHSSAQIAPSGVGAVVKVSGEGGVSPSSYFPAQRWVG